MFKFKRKNKKGFTLTELLIVVLVISVLAAVALPSYNRAVERTRAAQGVTTLQNIAKAQANYIARRGSYTSSMYALPIDLKDKDGKDVEGDTFSDQYFDYTIYGDVLSQSIAKREARWNYELAIDYDTGKLYCTPEDNEICKALGFDVNTKEIPEISSGGGSTNIVCNEYTCYLYDGDKIIGKCLDGRNKEGTGCANDRNGFICEKDWCAEYKDGMVLEGTDCNKEWVNKEGTGCAKQTFKCFKDKGVCITYKDDEEISSCKINKEGNACVTTVLQCNLSTGECWTEQDGEKLDGCSVSNEDKIDYDCAKKYNFSGKACTKEYCVQFDWNGNKILQCDYATNTCKSIDGKTCPANTSMNGCREEGGSSGVTFKCKEGVCYFYDEKGNEIGSCDESKIESGCAREYAGNGYYCYGEGKDKICKTFENGDEVMKCYADDGTCAYSGGSCKANETLTGCAEEGGSSSSGGKTFKCNDEGVCTFYDENGKEIGKCQGSLDGGYADSCVSEFGGSGFYCTVYADGNKICKVYENGKETIKCDSSSGTCDTPKGTCQANETFTGCKEESGSSNHEDGTFCTKDLCETYKDGQLISYCKYWDGGSDCHNAITGDKCTPNKDNTGCADDGSSSSGSSSYCQTTCQKGKCECFDDNGALYYSCNYNDHSCLEKVGYSGTYCYDDGTCETFVDGKYSYKCSKQGVCSVYDGEGKPIGKCTANDSLNGCAEDESSSSGLTCEGFTCTDDWGKTCYNNGKGECIKGDGLELACYKEKEECHWYENGKEVGICAINTTGDGCKEEGSSSGVYTCNGWECKDADGNVCYSNGKDGCIEGKGEEIVCMKGQCMTYKDGKKTDWCQANDDGTGCKKESSSGELTYDCGTGESAICTIYDEHGKEQGACYSNGHGGCIEGKDEEIVCYETGTCIIFKDGVKMDACQANDDGTGCKVEGEEGYASSCDAADEECHGKYKYTGKKWKTVQIGKQYYCRYYVYEEGKLMDTYDEKGAC